mgnify:CR=1 FL=1
MKKNENYNTQIMKQFNQSPVGFNPLLGELVDSSIAGLFMSQLLYWHGKGCKRGWIYKTVKELKRETCLTGSEQRRAIEKWVALGVLEKKIAGIPATRHFKVDKERLIELLEEQKQKTLLQESENKISKKGKQDCPI